MDSQALKTVYTTKDAKPDRIAKLYDIFATT